MYQWVKASGSERNHDQQAHDHPVHLVRIGTGTELLRTEHGLLGQAL